jgi:hypothetical protein
MTLHRRTILQQAAVAAATLAFGSTGQAESAAGVRRPAAYGPIGLELEGSFAGWVDSFQGGDWAVEVITDPPGTTLGVRKKHVANFGVSDIVLTVGHWMSSAFYQWLQETLARGAPRRSGAILTFDNFLRPIGRLEFGYALLKEVGFPALDAASREPAHFTVRIAPEQVRRVAATAAAPGLSSKGRSHWLVSNFRVAVDAVDTSSVSAIDALTVAQTLTTDFRGNVVVEAVTEPDLAITQPGAGTFGPWVDDFLVQGNRLDSNEKSGSLTLLAPNLKDTLFTLSFSHLGVAGYGPNAPEQAGAPMATRTQLYTEDLQFDFTPTW